MCKTRTQPVWLTPCSSVFKVAQWYMRICSVHVVHMYMYMHLQDILRHLAVPRVAAKCKQPVWAVWTWVWTRAPITQLTGMAVKVCSGLKVLLKTAAISSSVMTSLRSPYVFMWCSCLLSARISHTHAPKPSIEIRGICLATSSISKTRFKISVRNAVLAARIDAVAVDKLCTVHKHHKNFIP